VAELQDLQQLPGRGRQQQQPGEHFDQNRSPDQKNRLFGEWLYDPGGTTTAGPTSPTLQLDSARLIRSFSNQIIALGKALMLSPTLNEFRVSFSGNSWG
jgi:hypothetical protein